MAYGFSGKIGLLGCFLVLAGLFCPGGMAEQPNAPVQLIELQQESAGRLLQEDQVAADSEYQVGPENALQIDVFYGKGERISQKVRVSARGTINFPLIGEMQAAGLTVAGLENRLAQLLGADFLINPQVTVYIEEYSTVSILGEVRKSGVYPIKGRLTLVELVSLAEGFTKIAARNKVKVLRTHQSGEQETIPVRVGDLMNKDGDERENLVLRAGDVVIVPESLF